MGKVLVFCPKPEDREYLFELCRPVGLVYPETGRHPSDEYLFGDDLLVAPICDESDRRRVYLPKGTWTDWWTRKRLRGGRWIEAKAGLEAMPLYLREGAIVVVQGLEFSFLDDKPHAALAKILDRPVELGVHVRAARVGLVLAPAEVEA